MTTRSAPAAPNQLRAELSWRLAALEADHGALDPGGVERGRLLRLRSKLRPSAPAGEPVEFGPPRTDPDPTLIVEEPVS